MRNVLPLWSCLFLCTFQHISGACVSEVDCSLNGVCAAGVCACDAAWTGAACERLNIVPGPKNAGYRWIDPPINTSSWGGAVSYDVASQKWYMWVTELRDHCGMHTWTSNSHTVRASSVAPEGPYEREEVQFPVWSHEVDVTRGPAGEYVAFYSADIPAVRPVCEHCFDGTSSKLCKKERNGEVPITVDPPKNKLKLQNGLGNLVNSVGHGGPRDGASAGADFWRAKPASQGLAMAGGGVVVDGGAVRRRGGGWSGEPGVGGWSGETGGGGSWSGERGLVDGGAVRRRGWMVEREPAGGGGWVERETRRVVDGEVVSLGVLVDGGAETRGVVDGGAMRRGGGWRSGETGGVDGGAPGVVDGGAVSRVVDGGAETGVVDGGVVVVDGGAVRRRGGGWRSNETGGVGWRSGETRGGVGWRSGEPEVLESSGG
ncbi:hypothetical protein CYMTET_5638 [Cymbomonas tetramitiformis]|uniref:EGF-like domain-containing protein n=1 Tax=Cymbomonas tetramitiformis TaxID=36881 RepID=A0AAE0GZ43_9CHLO|nr:hypothetical protein CYMTET_5638 [Cymbomonas tetramitiformis]